MHGMPIRDDLGCGKRGAVRLYLPSGLHVSVQRERVLAMRGRNVQVVDRDMALLTMPIGDDLGGWERRMDRLQVSGRLHVVVGRRVDVLAVRGRNVQERDGGRGMHAMPIGDELASGEHRGASLRGRLR